MNTIDKHNSFPLYNSMASNLPSKDLSVKQKNEFIEKISKIDQTGRDLVVVLIEFYYLFNDSSVLSGLPYDAKTEETGKNKQNITWNFQNFPIKLRHILYKFVNIHIIQMEENQKINSERNHVI